MKLPIKYGRYLPKYKHNALIFISAFRLRLKVPHSMTELIRNIDIMEEYKISICVLLLHLLLNIERKKTDLNEISVLINCIKRTVPPIVERRRSIIHYLDKVYNELKSGEDQNNQGNNEERNNVWYLIKCPSDKSDNKKYPRIVEKQGKSPEQYEYPEDEEGE